MQRFEELDSTWTRCLFDEAPIAMALVAAGGRFTRCNSAFCSLVGYARAELCIRTWQSITHPDDIAGDEAGAAQLQHDSHQEVYTVAKRYLSKQGSIIWINLHVRSVWDDDKFICYYVVALPISQHGAHTPIEAKPKTLLEWVKSDPKSAVVVAGAASLFLGRDTLIALIHYLIGK